MTWKIGDITLPEDTILESSRFNETNISQQVTWSLTGAFIVEESQKVGGQPLVLDLGGIPKSLLTALYATASAQVAQTYTLETPSGNWTVVFRHPECFDVTPYVEYSDPSATDLYDVRVHLYRLDGWSG